MKNKKVMPTNEIVGAILQTHASDNDLDRFKSAPSDFLQEQGADIMMTEIAVVENESAMVHLCLPYYEGVESADLDFMSDENLASVSAGEIFATVISAGLLGSAILVAGVGALIGVLSIPGAEEEDSK